MVVIHSKNGVPIRITQERWDHIARRHPEIASQRTKVVETLSNPDFVLAGDSGELLATRFYRQTPMNEKYMIVAYREISGHDGFVLTAYFSNMISKRRKILWKR